RLIDLMMEMNPYLIDEASNSSSSDELLSDATSEDVEDVPMQATNKYEQPKQTLTKESKRKVTSPSSSSARKTTTTRPSPPQPSTASFSSTKSSGKRKAEESVPVEEAQTQKRRRKPTTVLMGNNISSTTTSIATAGIDSYVSELGDIQYEKSLGSARFMKTICGRHKEGPVVVKIFIKPEPSLSLSNVVKTLKEEREALSEIPNAFPYQRIIETEKAGYLIRQHFFN
ncbi:3638_t:CDS:2, partial [Entrophospora sp. SA101]